MLDPACGSGNFLYLALLALKDLEHRVIIEAEAMGLPRASGHCGPDNRERAGDQPLRRRTGARLGLDRRIQWMRRNGFRRARKPILKTLETIECRDALVTKKKDGNYEEARWPEAEFIVGTVLVSGRQANACRLCWE